MVFNICVHEIDRPLGSFARIRREPNFAIIFYQSIYKVLCADKDGFLSVILRRLSYQVLVQNPDTELIYVTCRAIVSKMLLQDFNQLLEFYQETALTITD